MNRHLRVSTFFVCSALLLTGCAKTVSKDEAGKFIEENYTSKEEKEMNAHSVTNVEKADGIFEGDTFKVGKEEEDLTSKVAPITKADLAIFSKDYFEFKVQGKKFIIEFNLKDAKDIFSLLGVPISLPEDAEFKGSASSKAVYDENGYPESSVSKFDVSFKYSKSGFTAEGNLKMSNETKYSFK